MTNVKGTYLDEFPPHRKPSDALVEAAEHGPRRLARAIRRSLRSVRRVSPCYDDQVVVWQGKDPGHGRVQVALVDC